MMEQIFTNGRIVLRDTVLEGTILVRNGKVDDIATGRSGVPAATDLEGDLLTPGFVELHTDNLEKHLLPRPSAHWPAIAALVAHDVQIVGAGITTVYDAMAIGDVRSNSVRKQRLQDMADSLHEAKEHDLLKADHLLHLRCEVSDPALRSLLDPLLESPELGLVSVMDHTPGQRQFVHLETYKSYYQEKYSMSDAEIEAFIEQRQGDQQKNSDPNRRYVVEQAQARNVRLASHDDATHDHVAEAVGDEMTIAEFPTTVEAAKASHAAGLAVMMGGPNLVRGGSHSGNVSARELAENGVLDVISSDYAPSSLLHGAMLLAEELETFDLPSAIATITVNPAEAAGLTDRGEIALGKNADLVRIKPTPHHPLIQGVWRGGARVA